MIKRKKTKTHFRYQLGVGQKNMAEYLGISPSLMAMWEKRNRSLPKDALHKLSWLQIDLEKIKTFRSAGPSHKYLQKRIKEEENKKAARLQNKVKLAKHKAIKQEEKINELIQKQENLLHWLNLVDQRLAELPKTAKTEGDRSWLAVQQVEIPIKLLKINKALTAMQLQLDLSRATTAVNEAHHRKLSK